MKTLKALLLVAVLLPASGLAQNVTVYRPKKFVGSALKPSVYVDGKQVARLQNGRFFP